jgi:pimeloyl-ACP methyl ester carboxylesterase
MAISEELGSAARVELSSGPIHYRDRGEGEAIVFVHGVFVNGDLWRGVVSRLADRYRCVTPDWPLGSHPEAMHADADLSTPGLARIVAEFLDALGLERVTLVGNDTGGAVCQLVLADHRQRVGRLVLTSCDAFEVYPPPPFGFLRVLPSIPGAAFVLAQSLRIRALRRLPIAYGWVMNRQPSRAVSDSYTRPPLSKAIRRDSKKMLKGISPEHTIGAAQRFADYEGPVMLAWAENDKLFPHSLADRLSEVLPQARREVVGGSRTFVAEDQPDRLADLIDRFIGDTPVIPDAEGVPPV